MAQTKSLKEQGLNEYIDPSKNPKYNQVYNEIVFTGDGITKEELETINTVVSLKDNKEEPEAIIGEERVPISKVKAGQKIRSISYNSEGEDTKVTEINYYRGKDETVESKKSKRKELKEQKEQNKEVQDVIVTLDEQITKEEQKVQKNKGNWDKKRKDKKAQVELIKTKTQTAYNSSNKELMDMLYPSKESIDKLNNEILEERRKSKEFLKNSLKPKLSFKEKLKQFIKIPEVFAWGDSSNSVNNLVIYNRSNWDYIWDVDNANASNGQTFKLWGRANDAPKQFRFVDARSEIRFVGKPGVEKCVDVDTANGQYDNGDKVHLWDCHSGNNQKFIVRSDGTIRPKFNQNYCLDASAGVAFGSRIHLWQCHGGQNQLFNAGEYDFGNTYLIKIYATEQRLNLIDWRLNGHVFISVERSDGSRKNTFSAWPGKDVNDYLNLGRSNNIYTDTNIHVDNDSDWNSALNPTGKRLRVHSIFISKTQYDKIKYMRGYYDTLSKYKNYNICFSNCASYSTALWNQEVGFNKTYVPRGAGILGPCDYPGYVYNALPYYIP